jgi:heptosyltransferase-2
MCPDSSKKHLLIVAPAWLGDLIVANALFRYLKKHQPTCTLHVLASETHIALLDRMREVDRVIGVSFTHGELRLWDRYQLARQLRREHYDQAIVLPNSFKSGLIPYWANIPVRTGWIGEQRYGVLNDIRRINKKERVPLLKQFVALGLESSTSIPAVIGWPALTISKMGIDHALAKFGLKLPTEPLLILCPGAAFGSSKRWICEYYATVANLQLNEGWQVWMLGALQDQGIANTMVSLTQNSVVKLVGKTTLNEAIDLMSLASVVISNDSGLMHMAAALDRPLIAIYGSSSPSYTPPLSKKAVIVQAYQACSPCFKRECPLPQQHYMQCMRSITPSQIVAHIDGLMKGLIS